MLLKQGFISTVAVALSAATPLSAQVRKDLPPPDLSRPPLLTLMPSDSSRYQTAHLRLMELLQVLQKSDAMAWMRLFESATPKTGPCRSSDAFSRMATKVRRIASSAGDTAFALFLDKVRIVDSGTAQIVSAELVLLRTASSEAVRTPVSLMLDPIAAAWKRETGLLEAFCGL